MDDGGNHTRARCRDLAEKLTAFAWPTDVIRQVEVTAADGSTTDLREEVLTAKRAEYRAESMRYHGAKTENATLRCVECSKPVSLVEA